MQAQQTTKKIKIKNKGKPDFLFGTA